MSLTLSLITINLTHPISFVAVILSQTMVICLMSHMMFKTPWFSYITFLIFIGGVMVLFIYISSLASNENFLILHKTTTTLLLTSFVVITLLNFLNKTLNHSYNMNLSALIDKMFSNQMFLMTTLTLIYLLLTLMIVVEIIKHFNGPLRSYNS